MVHPMCLLSWSLINESSLTLMCQHAEETTIDKYFLIIISLLFDQLIRFHKII